MRTLIIYHSEHHGNTENIAKAIGSATNAELVKSENLNPDDVEIILSEYDIIGFGSGIYNGKHHKSIFNLISVLPENLNKKVFIFSTSGVDALSHGYHNSLKNVLNSKGINVIGEFNCLGFDTAITSSGINHGKPDEKDLEDARRFVKNLTD